MSREVHTYRLRVDWKHDRTGEVVMEGKPTVEVATPPEFEGGIEGVISPEDLFVASAAACMMTTFVAVIKRMRVEFESFKCEAEGILEKLDTGFEFTKILLKTTVSVASEDLIAKTERALELAGTHCLIAKSMKCKIEHENRVVVSNK